MRYDPEAVRPMREELVRLGAEELHTTEDVDRVMGTREGTTLLIVNSICGCAAANARPAVAISRSHDVQPDRLVTVFAGQDLEATERPVSGPPARRWPCFVPVSSYSCSSDTRSRGATPTRSLAT